MKSSVENRKFLNPASTLDLASFAERAHRPKDGSIHIRTYSTGPDGSGFGRKMSPSVSASTFIRSSSSRYTVWKLPSIRMAQGVKFWAAPKQQPATRASKAASHRSEYSDQHQGAGRDYRPVLRDCRPPWLGFGRNVRARDCGA